MENINSDELLKLWKKGETLYSALYEFTSPHLLQEHSNSRQKLHDKNRNPRESGSSDTPSLMEGFVELGETIQLSSAIDCTRDELKRDLLEEIISDKIVGLGYETPIKSSDKPQVIPLHVWPQKIKEIDWNESSISKNGITFLNIRLIKKSALKKIKNKPDNKKTSIPKIKIEDKKIGRPSLKNKIIEAYEYLKKEQYIDYSKNLKSHTELIQETVQNLYPEITDMRGMQHEAIRRAISRQFQADKDNL